MCELWLPPVGLKRLGTVSMSTTGISVFPAIGDDLMRCVDLYNQAQSKWFEEMVTTSLVIKLRIHHLKSHTSPPLYRIVKYESVDF